MAEGRGRFITLEGIEGAGKSTHMDGVRALLESRGRGVQVTREPGGTRLGEGVRALLLDLGHRDMDPMAELLLVFAARAAHVAEVIEPALSSGRWVLCDRFTDATYAYQGGGRQLGPGPVAALEHLVQGDLRPDLTVILDVPVEVGLTRVDHRARRDRFELEAQGFFQRIREVYLERARSCPDRYRVVDATASREETAGAIARAVESLL